MNVEKSSEPLNKRDILKVFGDRVLIKEKEKVEREYLDFNPDLANVVPSDIIERYKEVSIDDCSILNPEYLDSSWSGKPLFLTLLKEDPPISLMIEKVMWEPTAEAKAETGRGAETMSKCTIWMLKGDLRGESDSEIIREDEKRKNEIGSIRLDEDEDAYSMLHRFVGEKYRGPQNEAGDRISNMLLAISEQVVQDAANSDGRPKKIRVSPGQLDVMIWLYNNGYRPANQIDKERFEKICNADEDLRIVDDFYIFHKDELPQLGRVPRRYIDTYNVSFVKTMQPNSVPTTTRGKAQKTLENPKNS